LVETLTPTQLAEYQKAKDWKIEAYLPFVPPKPEIARLSDENHVEARQSAAAMTGKPRVSIIIIGNVDSGIFLIFFSHSHFFLRKIYYLRPLNL
jgi:hypothetical protein